MGAFSNVKGLTFYRDNNEDPYITLKEVNFFPTYSNRADHFIRTTTTSNAKN